MVLKRNCAKSRCHYNCTAHVSWDVTCYQACSMPQASPLMIGDWDVYRRLKAVVGGC